MVVSRISNSEKTRRYHSELETKSVPSAAQLADEKCRLSEGPGTISDGLSINECCRAQKGPKKGARNLGDAVAAAAGKERVRVSAEEETTAQRARRNECKVAPGPGRSIYCRLFRPPSFGGELIAAKHSPFSCIFCPSLSPLSQSVAKNKNAIFILSRIYNRQSPERERKKSRCVLLALGREWKSTPRAVKFYARSQNLS